MSRFKSSEAYGVIAVALDADVSAYELRGFICDADGVVAIEQPGNDTPVIIPVVAGAIYPISAVLFNTTGTTAGMGITGIL